MSEIYYTDSDRRKFSAQRSAATRKRNKELEQERIKEARRKRAEYNAKEAIERPLREAKQAVNRTLWLKYWRGRICDAMDASDATLAEHRIDSVIFEIADWGGYAGFSTPFVQPVHENNNASTDE